jgi:hypothetical protein
MMEAAGFYTAGLKSGALGHEEGISVSKSGNIQTHNESLKIETGLQLFLKNS